MWQNPGHKCEHGNDSYYQGPCPGCEAERYRARSRNIVHAESQWMVLYANALRAHIEKGTKHPADAAFADANTAAELAGLAPRTKAIAPHTP